MSDLRCKCFVFPGSCFIRTDQLDGETDWKLRVTVACTQRLPALGVWTFSCTKTVHTPYCCDLDAC